MQICQPLRQLRESLGLSRRAFAARLGLHKSTIGDIEAGREPPGRLFLSVLERRYRRQLADLGYSIDDVRAGGRRQVERHRGAA